MRIFTSARVKLTAWYTLIIFLITLVLSASYYARTIWVLDRQFHGIENRLETERFPLTNLANPARKPQNPRLQILQSEYDETRGEILRQIAFFNALIVVMAGFASYFLAGKTLQPIQKALEGQKRFVADAAHELKTPITALKASLEVNLMDKKLPKKARKVLRKNLLDVKNLQSLVENLLILAQAEEKNGLVWQPMTLKVLVDSVVKQITPLAKAKQISVKSTFADPKVGVLGEMESLETAFLTLLDNAVKYGRSKTTVQIKVRQSKQQVMIEVINQGQGISKADLPHIFERFYRAERSRTKQGVEEAGGYGLGLSVAKRIVEKHRGSISVSSQLGKTTVFTISLPLYRG